MFAILWFRYLVCSLLILRTIHGSTISRSSSDDDFALATCHRKLQPGKRMMGMFIERVVNCENLQDCCRACDYEKTFVCKGFNHRGRVDGSKCTCELTSTPHFRMDADEDFLTDSHCDYYEKTDDCSSSTWRDRNNIPYWREPIKSYKQNDQNRWSNGEAVDKDFVREPPIYRDGSDSPYRESAHHFFNGPARSNEQFHYEEPHGFTSRYNALNWNRNWKGPESDITKDNILPNSRLNYNKEYLDVKSSIFSKSRPGDRSQTEDRLSVHPLSVSDKNDHLYGKFYNYGGAFGYNSYPSIPRESHYGKHETSQICRCSMKLVSGSKLSRRVIRKTCLAHDLEQCEEFCINETSFPCESFAYRYSVLTTNPTDNCLLSDHSYQHLNFYTDLEPNRDYDSYILTPDAKICYSRKSTGRQPSEECFSRIRSGFTMPVDITRRSMSVHDLGECQFACTASREFVCRSLVFRYGTDSHGRYSQDRESSNCFLTDWSSEEINPINMPDMDGAELYERNTVSYGCDTYPLQSSISNAITPNDKGPSPVHTDERCYSEYHRPCKLMSHAVVSSARASTKLDCRRKCSTMRNTGTVPCMSFNYIINNGNTVDNCFLSDISIRDLRPNLDYVHDNEHTLYTWKDFDPYCRLMANAYNTINSTPMFETYDQVHPSTLSYANGQGALGSRNHIFGSDFDSSVWWRNKFTPEGHEYDYKHEFTNQDSKVPVDSGTFEHGHNLFYSNQLSPSHHYTVNGYPCKNTTVCQQNEITGFWSCEIEDEYGSWDYCCKPSHQCGFSQGYHYPWCYVGSNENQWRPCSETYYPYYSAKDHSIYRQSPLYTARHWPVIYFHETSPLNCSANDPDHKNS